MAFAVTETFTSDVVATASGVNKNFTDVETELSAFPTTGALNDGAVSTAAKLADAIITTAKFATTAFKDEDDMASDLATAAASQQSIKAYVDSNPSWTTYAGGESVVYPNGLIFKHGEVSSLGADSVENVDFGTAFPSGAVSGSATIKGVVAGTASQPPVCTVSASGITVVNDDGSAHNVYWQAWGY